MIDMLRSMTAFGRSGSARQNDQFVCEIRSVNHRYLDTSVRLPESLRSLEPLIREQVASRLHRGKIEINIRRDESSPPSSALSLNEPLLQQLAAAADRVSELTGSAKSADPLTLLQWPGVMVPDRESLDDMAQNAMATFERALDDFLESREREGVHIAALLSAKTQSISELVNVVRKARPELLARQREKLIAKLEALDMEYDATRLEQELVYAAQRLDVDEELDRLDAHVVELEKVLKRKEAIGRRLDFLMQEFNREANTLSSKSHDSVTTAASVDMKVLIEQMREQVQNVE
ncbi:MAG: YicC/YloC family endoribonuclease [Granulosicoccus sp.]